MIFSISLTKLFIATSIFVFFIFVVTSYLYLNIDFSVTSTKLHLDNNNESGLKVTNQPNPTQKQTPTTESLETVSAQRPLTNPDNKIQTGSNLNEARKVPGCGCPGGCKKGFNCQIKAQQSGLFLVQVAPSRKT